MSFKIRPSYGAEIYVSEAGYICIKQNGDSFDAEDPIVSFLPNEIPEVIEMLKKACETALNVETIEEKAI